MAAEFDPEQENPHEILITVQIFILSEMHRETTALSLVAAVIDERTKRTQSVSTRLLHNPEDAALHQESDLLCVLRSHRM